jgi:hypothetical protein
MGRLPAHGLGNLFWGLGKLYFDVFVIELEDTTGEITPSIRLGQAKIGRRIGEASMWKAVRLPDPQWTGQQ